MSERELTPDLIAAQRWVDSLMSMNRWRLQTLVSRYRTDPKTGERIEVPVRIRRFAEGCPAGGVKYAVDYLMSLAPYKGVIVNGQTLDGEYLPTRTEWKRDGQDQMNPPYSKGDFTYTLIQDIVDRTVADTLGVVSSSSCSEEAVADYVWDSPVVEDLPVGGPGVTYSVQALSRNEDGTFNYAIVKRTAITQHMPETEAEDNLYHRVTVETWDNVYRDGDDFTDGTSSLGIPKPGVSGRTETKVSVSENPDCTFKVQVTRETVKEVSVRDQSQHTQFEGSHENDVLGSAVPLGTAPDASGGKVTVYDSQLQADGTFTLKKRVTVERPVNHSEVEVRVTAKGRRVTVTDTNQAVPATTDGVKLGGAVKVTKTPGGLFTNTTSTWDKTSMVSGESCHEDLFSHSDSKTTAGLTELPTGHVTGGSGGLVVTRRTTLDEEGAIVQVVDTEREREVRNAEEVWSVGLDGVTHQVSHRNLPVASKPVAPVFSTSTIGRQVRYSYTPGGLVNVSVTELDRSTGVLDTEAECATTVFEHVDSTSKTNPTGAVSVDHRTAGGGRTYQRSSRLLGSGSVTETERETVELPYKSAEVQYRRTTRGLVTSVSDRNGDEPATAGLASKPGQSASHSVTPGGKFNLTKVTFEPSSEPDSAFCSDTLFEHVHDDVKMSDRLDPSDVAPAGAGVHRTKSSDLDQDGFCKTTVRTTTEKHVSEAEVRYRRTLRGLITSRTDQNVMTPATPDMASKAGQEASHQTNPGGSYNLTKVTIDPSYEPDSAYSAATVFEKVVDDVTMSDELDTDEVAAAGNGLHRVKSSDLDQDGFCKTTVRTTTELDVPDSDVEVTSDFFTKTRKTVHSNSTKDAPADLEFVSEGSNKLVTKSASMTQGGRRNFTETEVSATFRTWDHTVDLNRQYEYHLWFVNATKEQYKSLVDSAQAAFSAKEAGWDAAGRTPSSTHVSPSLEHNRFGTFDGHFTFSASWSPESAGQTGDLDVEFSHVEYDRISRSYEPSTDSDGNPRVKITQLTTHILQYDGRGSKSFVDLTFVPQGVYSMSCSIDPVTRRYSVSKATDENIEINYEEG